VPGPCSPRELVFQGRYGCGPTREHRLLQEHRGRGRSQTQLGESGQWWQGADGLGDARASAGVAGVTADVFVPSRLLAPPNVLVKKPKAINTLWDFVGHTETLVELWCINRRASPVFLSEGMWAPLN